MPQLPSGKHFAIDVSPLQRLIDDAYEGTFVHVLMAIEEPQHMFGHVSILYFRPRSLDTADWSLSAHSDALPTELEPYPSGYNLLTIKPEVETWSSADQNAFIAFLNTPSTAAYFDEALNAVRAAQQQLLGHPSSLGGLIATWWQHGCHPLQEPLND